MAAALSSLQKRSAAATIVMLLGVSQALGQAPAKQDLYLNTTLPVTQRVDDLVSRMTLAEKISQMQNEAPTIPRLRIAEYNWWNEGLHGVARSGYATVFPQAIGLAATWGTKLVQQVADTISTEAQAKYNQAQREDNHCQPHRAMINLPLWWLSILQPRSPQNARLQGMHGFIDLVEAIDGE